MLYRFLLALCAVSLAVGINAVAFAGPPACQVRRWAPIPGLRVSSCLGINSEAEMPFGSQPSKCFRVLVLTNPNEDDR